MLFLLSLNLLDMYMVTISMLGFFSFYFICCIYMVIRMTKMIVFCFSHIKEHLKDVVEKPKEEMTEEELEFHYFKLHDYDGNNKLDGTEITKAITHFHDGRCTQILDPCFGLYTTLL